MGVLLNLYFLEAILRYGSSGGQIDNLEDQGFSSGHHTCIRTRRVNFYGTK